jgi:hypothetical protein
MQTVSSQPVSELLIILPAEKNLSPDRHGAWQQHAEGLRKQGLEQVTTRDTVTNLPTLSLVIKEGDPERANLLPALFSIAKDLKEALEQQDLTKLIEVRRVLHDQYDHYAFSPKEKAEAGDLLQVADGIWEKLQQELIKARGELDQKSLPGSEEVNTREAFEARLKYWRWSVRHSKIAC